MTRDEIAARNRANASKSTGPKTVQGKAVVAGNARRHGATARPDPAAVATWLRIILDDPDITAKALVPTDARGYRALMLAQAEVQLVTATNALRDFEAGMPLILRVAKQLTGKTSRRALRLASCRVETGRGRRPKSIEIFLSGGRNSEPRSVSKGCSSAN